MGPLIYPSSVAGVSFCMHVCIGEQVEDLSSTDSTSPHPSAPEELSLCWCFPWASNAVVHMELEILVKLIRLGPIDEFCNADL